jgi:hypothetical protein
MKKLFGAVDEEQQVELLRKWGGKEQACERGKERVQNRE